MHGSNGIVGDHVGANTGDIVGDAVGVTVGSDVVRSGEGLEGDDGDCEDNEPLAEATAIPASAPIATTNAMADQNNLLHAIGTGEESL